MKEQIKKLEEMIPDAVDSIKLHENNSIWNEKQGTMLKSLTGALRDLQEYQSKKFGKKTDGNKGS